MRAYIHEYMATQTKRPTVYTEEREGGRKSDRQSLTWRKLKKNKEVQREKSANDIQSRSRETV